MRRRLLLCLAFMGLAAPARANDDLKPLADLLMPLRASHGANTERDAGPEFTPVKQALRAWVENSIAEAKGNGDKDALASLAGRLNADLEAAGLTCGRDGTHCPDDPQFNARGYLGDIHLSYRDGGRYLIVQTRVGMTCGYDESVYLYEQHATPWRLLFQKETDDYRDDQYVPLHYLAIRVSPSNALWNVSATPPLILTLGTSPWCSSNWQGIVADLVRASPDTPPLLLHFTDTLFLGNDPVIAEASVTAEDVLIEYQGDSIDWGRLVRSHVRHYRISKDVQRIAPIALSPNDFVDEWLTSPWRQSRTWTDRKIAALAQRRHRKLQPGPDKALSGNLDEAKRCRRDPALWQTAFARFGKNGDPKPAVYFLVRWQAPYRFTLMGVRDRRYPGCNVTDAMPDNPGTLFSVQD